MPRNAWKEENEKLRKEAEEARREVERLTMKVEMVLNILKAQKEGQ
jgi:hypothetical protein